LLGRTVEELGDSMSGEEFGLWLAMLEVEPMGAPAVLPAMAELKAELRNGPLAHPAKRLWAPGDFLDVNRWAPPAAPAAPPSPRAFVNRLRASRKGAS
jgi:hypothetical protein